MTTPLFRKGHFYALKLRTKHTVTVFCGVYYKSENGEYVFKYPRKIKGQDNTFVLSRDDYSKVEVLHIANSTDLVGI